MPGDNPKQIGKNELRQSPIYKNHKHLILPTFKKEEF
jgi:hypothetical protein